MDKPYLIMLPGWSMDKNIWGSFSDSLSGRFQIERLDWEGICSTESFKDKVSEHISKAGARSVSLLGWSLGAIVALELAAELYKPLDRLILISPTSRFTQDKESGYRAGWGAKVLDRMIRNLDLRGEETVSSFRSSLFSESEIERILNTPELDNLKAQDIEQLKLGLEYLKKTDLRESVQCVSVPTLMVHGEADRIVPVEASKYMAERNMNSFELKTIERCGHVPFLTEEELCLKYIEEFMDRGDDA